MARILLIGWDGRAPALARELQERGHLVRGTASAEAELPPIEEAGAEAVVADPDRLGTVLPHLQGVSAICWLAGDSPRLEPLVETLVDTHVRGLVCEPGPCAQDAGRVAEASKVGFETVAEAAAMGGALDRLLGI
jgi:nucleoside-diphosphate-sugar epimerase